MKIRLLKERPEEIAQDPGKEAWLKTDPPKPVLVYDEQLPGPRRIIAMPMLDFMDEDPQCPSVLPQYGIIREEYLTWDPPANVARQLDEAEDRDRRKPKEQLAFDL